MSKKLVIAAVAAMAISAPTSAFAGHNNQNEHLQGRVITPTHNEYSRACAKGANSAARGSIYNMAGPCGSVTTVVYEPSYCEYRKWKKSPFSGKWRVVVDWTLSAKQKKCTNHYDKNPPKGASNS